MRKNDYKHLEVRNFLGTREFEVYKNGNRYNIDVIAHGSWHQEHDLWYSDAKEYLTGWGLSFTQVTDLLQ